MAKERKKVETKIVIQPQVKQRISEEIKSVEKIIEVVKSNDEDEMDYKPSGTTPKQAIKYVKLLTGSSAEEIKSVRDKVNAGELKYSYFGVDGNRGCYYYLIIKK